MDPNTLPAVQRLPPTAMIEAIGRQLATGLRYLTFAPALERRFESDNWLERRRYLIRCSLLGLVVYNGSLVVDWLLMPDAFPEACIRQLAIFTPFVTLILLMFPYITSVVMRESIVSLVNFCSFVLTATLVIKYHGDYQVNYLNGNILFMINSIVVLRIRFFYAVAVNLCLVTFTILIMACSGAFDAPTMAAGVSFFVSAGVMLLVFGYVLEREQRLGYLMALRSRFLTQQLDLRTKIDPLTELWNRRYLDRAMHAAWNDPSKVSMPMALIILDVDHFKAYNDCNGHLQGDECLRQVGRCLANALDDVRDVLVRFGGEEFLVFLPGRTLSAGAAVAERLRRAVQDAAIAHPALGAVAVVSVSCGVTAGLPSAVTPAALIAAADTALYGAKAAGRDCVRLTASASTLRATG